MIERGMEMNEEDRRRLDALDQTMASLSKTFNEEVGDIKEDVGEIKGQMGIIVPLFSRLVWAAIGLGLVQVLIGIGFVIVLVSRG